MADLKISQLPVFTSAVPATDAFAVVSGGTTKQITTNQILGSSGVATLASATITGAATVGTTLGVTGNITGSGANPNLDNSSLNLFLSGGTTGDPAISFSRYGSASLNNRGAKIQYVYRLASSQESGSLAFYSNPDSAGTGSLVERMRIDYSGDVNISTGNVVMATSGKGIDFSATASGSGTMTSELLNDYEEGVFDAFFITGGGTVTINPAVNQCRYTKIGRLVTVQGSVQVSSVSSPTGPLLISGLPYTIATGAEGNAYSAASLFPSGLQATATGQIVGYGPVGSVSIYMYRYEAGAIIGLAPSAQAASEFTFTFTYSV